MTNKLHLTNKVIDDLCALDPARRQRRYWDTKLDAFYVSFSKKGTASFCIRYTKANGLDGDYSLGLASLLTVEQARNAARQKLAELTLNGVDPVADRRRVRREAIERDTNFAMAVERFIAFKEKNRVLKRQRSDVYLLRKYVVPVLGKEDINEISRQTIKTLIGDIQAGVAKRSRRKRASGKATANDCHAALRAFYRWAYDSELTERNPADFPPLFTERVVKRYGRLNHHRFRVMWAELLFRYNFSSRNRVALAILIFLATLQRPIDVARARKADFNFETKMWRIVESPTKTDEFYEIPMSPLVVALVQEAFRRDPESPWLFCQEQHPSEHMPEGLLTHYWIRSRRRLMASGQWDDVDVELYDGRRYGRTEIVRTLGFSSEVAERVINHAESQGMSTRYDVHDYSDDVRLAQEAWSRNIQEVTGTAIGELFSNVHLLEANARRRMKKHSPSKSRNELTAPRPHAEGIPMHPLRSIG